ncbi:MAG: hypothetical protein JWO05_2535 [Gemmatimonadetes bacterium]|nr:hypothetical protein [Gemmatimonadota bacterium]
MTQVLLVGSGHLASRVEQRLLARGDAIVRFEGGPDALSSVDLAAISSAFLLDDHDERNLALVIALVSIRRDIPVTVALFNENIAPHLRAANPNIRVLNPARIAAPAFIHALTAPLEHTLRYTPATWPAERSPVRADTLITRLVGAFAALIIAAVTFFHFVVGLSWLDSLYFVIVTVATVGYGDINLATASPLAKLVGIALILGSTFFIWMIFSLTVDAIIKKRVQLALGRRRYDYSGHVILCGLGRLGFFIAEGLLERGERVLVIEREEDAADVEYFRRRGADVYIGDARLLRVLEDTGARRAKALYSVIDDDYVNLEIGLNARSFQPGLRLVLRLYDEPMSQRISETLDIHLSFSMTAIASEQFVTGEVVAT